MITECEKCGEPLMGGIEYCLKCKQANPDARVRTFAFMPWWAWPFVVLCGAVPVIVILTGGQVPGFASLMAAAVGVGGAIACAGIAKNPNRSVGARVGRCAVYTLGTLCLFLILTAVGIWRLEQLRNR